MNLLAILKRRRYKRRVGLKSIKDSLRNAVLQLSVMMSIHSMLIMLIEKKSVFESIWFTMVSVTTVGYGGFIPQNKQDQLDQRFLHRKNSFGGPFAKRYLRYPVQSGPASRFIPPHEKIRHEPCLR